MPPEISDPYTYPGTRVLKNKPGIRDDGALRQFEYEQTALRIQELREKPITGNYDIEHFKAIHAHVFQDVYVWAGEIRTVNISKGGPHFASTSFIESEANKISASLASEGHLKALEKPNFVDRLAHYYAEWNALHPFREGNGRATREIIWQLARGAGYELDQTRIDNNKKRWDLAAQSSFNGDLEPIKEFFTKAVRPSRAVAFEQLLEADALAKHPELKGVFESLQVMCESLRQHVPNDEKARVGYMAKTREEILINLDAGKILSSPFERVVGPPAKAEPLLDNYQARGIDR